MQPGKPSQTALATAFLRALHRVVDDQPWVLDDPVATALLPGYQQRFLQRVGRLPRSWNALYRQRYLALNAMRAQIVVRARYTEDALAAARTRGVTRYVVLAAGLDTFAWRQPTPESPIATLEIDHPATQAWKQALIAERGLARAGSPDYLAVDFETDDLRDRLAAGGPHPCGPHPGGPQQFISWLGTTYYLTEAAIRSTLTALADCSASGSELVLDYWCEPPLFDASRPLLAGTRIATALQREPMRSLFRPDVMEALVRSSGWQIREHCAPGIQQQRYLAERNDGLTVPTFAYLLHLELA